MPTRRPDPTNDALLELLDGLLALAMQQLDEEQDPDAATQVMGMARGLLVLDEPLSVRLASFQREALAVSVDHPDMGAELAEVLDLVVELAYDQGHGCAEDPPCDACRVGVECPSPGCETVEHDDRDEHGPF